MTLTVVPPAAPDRDSRRRESWRVGRQLRGELVVLERFGASLRLVPPGRRKGNRFWLVRGRLRDGRQIEVSTKTVHENLALRAAMALATGKSPAAARAALGETSQEGAAANKKAADGSRIPLAALT